MEKEEKKSGRKQNLRGTDYTRRWFVKELAERADFYQKDIEILLDMFMEILAEIIGEKKTLSLSGLFKMYLSEKKACTYYNASAGKFGETGKSYYVSFKPSRKLLRYLPEMQNESFDDEEE